MQNASNAPDGVRVYPVAWASSRLLPATSLQVVRLKCSSRAKINRNSQFYGF